MRNGGALRHHERRAGADPQKRSEGYRNLSYVLSLQGLPAGDDLPGDDRPETVQKLYDETNGWMFGARPAR